jgi:hypothetical protein
MTHSPEAQVAGYATPQAVEAMPRPEPLRKGRTVWVALSTGDVFEAVVTGRDAHLLRVEWARPWGGESLAHPDRIYLCREDALNAL